MSSIKKYEGVKSHAVSILVLLSVFIVIASLFAFQSFIIEKITESDRNSTAFCEADYCLKKCQKMNDTENCLAKCRQECSVNKSIEICFFW